MAKQDITKAIEPIKHDGRYTLLKEGSPFEHKQLLHILQATPKDHIKSRAAKGGGTWTYVTGTYVKKVLNYVFAWNWDFEVVDSFEKHGQIVVLGRLTVRVPDGNGGFNSISKQQYGNADIKYKKKEVEKKNEKTGKMYKERVPSDEPLDFGNDYKAATTDALKKCASEFGIASDIYGKEEFRDVTVDERAERKGALEEVRENIKKGAYNKRSLQAQLKQLQEGNFDDEMSVEDRDELIELIEDALKKMTPKKGAKKATKK